MIYFSWLIIFLFALLGCSSRDDNRASDYMDGLARGYWSRCIEADLRNEAWCEHETRKFMERVRKGF